MIIGENIRISGTIEADGEADGEAGGEGDADVVVRGRVEGTVRIRGTLTVAAGGWLIADCTVGEAKIDGTVRGNITARNGIEVSRTGRMLGDAVAPRVTIAAGAGFRGRVEMGDLAGAELEAPPARAAASGPARTAPAAAPAATPVPRAAATLAPTGSPAPAASAVPGVRPVPRLARPGTVLRRRSGEAER